jgi:hypothetical protein
MVEILEKINNKDLELTLNDIKVIE